MENLIIEQRGQFIFRRVLGALMIALAIVFLITVLGSINVMDMFMAVFFLCFGILFFPSLVGSARSKAEIVNGSLKIKWDGWIKSIVVHESDIDRIIVRKDSGKIV